MINQWTNTTNKKKKKKQKQTNGQRNTKLAPILNEISVYSGISGIYLGNGIQTKSKWKSILSDRKRLPIFVYQCTMFGISWLHLSMMIWHGINIVTIIQPTEAKRIEMAHYLKELKTVGRISLVMGFVSFAIGRIMFYRFTMFKGQTVLSIMNSVNPPKQWKTSVIVRLFIGQMIICNVVFDIDWSEFIDLQLNFRLLQIISSELHNIAFYSFTWLIYTYATIINIEHLEALRHNIEKESNMARFLICSRLVDQTVRQLDRFYSVMTVPIALKESFSLLQVVYMIACHELLVNTTIFRRSPYSDLVRTFLINLLVYVLCSRLVAKHRQLFRLIEQRSSQLYRCHTHSSNKIESEIPSIRHRHKFGSIRIQLFLQNQHNRRQIVPRIGRICPMQLKQYFEMYLFVLKLLTHLILKELI